MLWDKSSSVGSRVSYKCDQGYVSIGDRNESVCTVSGDWRGASLTCQGDNHVHLCVSVMPYFCSTDCICSVLFVSLSLVQPGVNALQ